MHDSMLRDFLFFVGFVVGAVVFIVLLAVGLCVGNQAWNCHGYQQLSGANVMMAAGTCYIKRPQGWVTLDSYTDMRQRAQHIDVAQ